MLRRQTLGIDWHGMVIPRVQEILEGYNYRPTLRQVFYRLVAELLIPNTENAYKGLSRATVQAREEGLIDSLAFQDRVRTYEGGDEGFESPDEFMWLLERQLRDAGSNYSRPMW